MTEVQIPVGITTAYMIERAKVGWVARIGFDESIHEARLPDGFSETLVSAHFNEWMHQVYAGFSQ